MNNFGQRNLDEFIVLGALLHEKPQVAPDLDELRHTCYFLKMIGLLWFEGSVPTNPNKKFDCYLNLDWPTEEPPEGMNGVRELITPAIQWLTVRFSKPSWVNKDPQYQKMSLIDMHNMFKDFTV
jgi:hypothetical protein